MSKKRKCFNLKTKIEIFEELDRGVKRNEICLNFGIVKSTLAGIIKDREKIYDTLASGNAVPKSKKMRGAKYADIEELLFDWFQKMREKSIPIGGVLIKEKARALAAEFEITDFSASDGWVQKFLNRFNISLQSICGELNKVGEEKANDWITFFEGIKSKFRPQDVYNMDKTGIFFNLFPDQTYAIKAEKCHGGEKSKQRLTAVLCCNSDGSEKMRPWVIGKSKKPQCFKNVDLSL